MAYFPFFMEVSAGEGLIVGGGRVALRKIEKLLPYGARLAVCAEAFLPEIEGIPSLNLLRRPFAPSMLDGKLFAIAAASDSALNRQISVLCQERRIPVNVADNREACSFLFPALVKQGDLSIGISTGGASPSAAVYWKERIADLIPEDTAELLAYLDGLRGVVKESIPDDGQKREAVYSALFRLCMEDGWPLYQEALENLLAQGEENLL